MAFGLTQQNIQNIHALFRQFPGVKKVIIFGSRAMGNYKKGSDVDLVIMDDVDSSIMSKVSSLLNEETTLPYIFDVIQYSTIANDDLKKHIETYGKIFYEN